MPTYAYQCESCGNEFDLRQSFDASPEQPCPVCSSTGRRRFSPPTVIYKGSGFYTTDYARKSIDSSSSSSASSSASTSSSEKKEKSDSKSADSKSKASSTSE